MSEREQIVAWLRKAAVLHTSKWGVSVDPHMIAIADAIERGDHLPQPPSIEDRT